MQLHTEPCDCYECVGPEYHYSEDGHRSIVNNLKKHTQFEPCGECGRPKTEYLDLGRKGYYVCWWCRDRAADGEIDHFHRGLRALNGRLNQLLGMVTDPMAHEPDTSEYKCAFDDCDAEFDLLWDKYCHVRDEHLTG